MTDKEKALIAESSSGSFSLENLCAPRNPIAWQVVNCLGRWKGEERRGRGGRGEGGGEQGENKKERERIKEGGSESKHF